MDDAQFRIVVAQHKDRVFSFAAWSTGDPELASDIVQEAFMRLWKHRQRVDETTSRAWLLKTARRLVIDHRRKQRSTVSADAIDGFLAAAPADTGLHDSERRRAVALAYAELSEKDQTLLHLRDVQDLPHEQIASILGMGHAAVRVGVHRARGRLRDLLLKAGVTS